MTTTPSREAFCAGTRVALVVLVLSSAIKSRAERLPAAATAASAPASTSDASQSNKARNTPRRTENQPPVANGIDDVVMDEDAERVVLSLLTAFEDPDDPGAALAYEVTGNTAPDVVRASAGEETLILTPVSDASGEALISITVTDADGGSVTDDLTVSIVPVNDAPVLTAAAPMLPDITEDDVDNNGAFLDDVLGSSVQDVDPNAVAGIAVVALDALAGEWQYASEGRLEWITIGRVSLQEALLLRATDRLRFVPAGQTDSTASIEYVAWDQSAGAAGATEDASISGGRTAFSTASDILSVHVTAVNDPPGIDLDQANSGTGFEAVFDTTGAALSIAAANGLVIEDVDDVFLQSARVTIGNAFDAPDEILSVDTATRSITVVYDADTAVLSLDGTDTVAAYQAVLQTVMYENTRTARTTAARSIEFTVSDGDSDSIAAIATVAFRDEIELVFNGDWNLLSTPFSSDADVALDKMLSSEGRDVLFNAPLWMWSTEQQRYVTVGDGLEARRAFWAHSSVSVATPTRLFSGSAATSATLHLTHGWNLIGPPWDGAAQLSDVALSPFWSWDASAQLYSELVEEHTLERGRGYWIYAVKDGDIEITPETTGRD